MTLSASWAVMALRDRLRCCVLLTTERYRTSVGCGMDGIKRTFEETMARDYWDWPGFAIKMNDRSFIFIAKFYKAPESPRDAIKANVCFASSGSIFDKA